MDNRDTFSDDLEECIACLGRMRPAWPREIEAHLRNVKPEYLAAVEAHPGTWYICRRCGPGSVVKSAWIELDMG